MPMIGTKPRRLFARSAPTPHWTKSINCHLIRPLNLKSTSFRKHYSFSNQDTTLPFFIFLKNESMDASFSSSQVINVGLVQGFILDPLFFFTYTLSLCKLTQAPGPKNIYILMSPCWHNRPHLFPELTSMAALLEHLGCLFFTFSPLYP